MVGDYYQNHELKYPMIVKIIKDIVNNKLKFSPLSKSMMIISFLLIPLERCELCIYKSKLFRVIFYDFLM